MSYIPEYKRLGLKPNFSFPVSDNEQVNFDVDPLQQTIAVVDGKNISQEIVDDQNLQEAVIQENTENSETELSEVFSQMNVGDWVVLLEGQVMFVGNDIDTENYVNDLIMGRVIDRSVLPEEVFVYQRIGLKVGIFLNKG